MKKEHLAYIALGVVIVFGVWLVQKPVEVEVRQNEALGGPFLVDKYANASTTVITVGSTNVMITATSSSRTNYTVVNDSVEPVFLNFSDPATVGEGIRLTATSTPFVMSSEHGNVFTGSIHGIAGANATVFILEYQD